MIEIRPEQPGDEEAIAKINRRAFGGEEEVGIIGAIRKSEFFIPELSLVAESDGRITGHIMFSTISLFREGGPQENILSLAPMAVDPEEQNRGTGSALVRAGMEKARELGHRIVIVIGHPGYYPRFGFEQARRNGFEIAFEVPDEAFMVAGLQPEALLDAGGMVQFTAPFNMH